MKVEKKINLKKLLKNWFKINLGKEEHLSSENELNKLNIKLDN